MNPTDPYIKMCIAATEIQKLKFLDEIEDVEYDEVFRRYKFEKGNLYEHLGIVSTNDHE